MRRALGRALAVALVVGACAFGAVTPASAATVQPDANGEVTVSDGDVLVVKQGENIKIIVLFTDATLEFDPIPYEFEGMQLSSVDDGYGDQIGVALSGVILGDAYMKMSVSGVICGGDYGGLPICGRDILWTYVPNPAASANADLTSLTLDTPDLTPAFDAAELSYAGSVPYTTSSTVVTPTLADPSAAVTVNGTTVASGTPSSVALAEGANTISVLVTAANGSTKTYTITVTRAPAPAPPTWTDHLLAGIQVSIPYEDAVSATGAGPIAYSVVSGALPAGLSLDPTSGAVSGTPSTAGAFAFTIQAANAVAAITQAFSGVVRAKPMVDLLAGFQPGDTVEGSLLTVSGTDLPDGSAVSVVLSSTVTLYSSVVTGAGGTVLALLSLPAGIAAGSHELQLVSVAPGGATVTSSIWFSALENGTVASVSRFPPIGTVPPAPVTMTTELSPAVASTPTAVAGTGVGLFSSPAVTPTAVAGTAVGLFSSPTATHPATTATGVAAAGASNPTGPVSVLLAILCLGVVSVALSRRKRVSH